MSKHRDLRTKQSQKSVKEIVLNKTISIIKTFNAQGKTPVLMEIGSGQGYFLHELESNLNAKGLNCVIESGDIEPEQMVSDTINTHIFNAQDEFNLSRKYDLIIAIDLLEHIENPFHFIREIAKSLIPNGQVILTSPNILSIRSRLRFLLTGCYDYFRRPYNEHRLNMGHVNPINAIQLNYILRKNGFLCKSIQGNTMSLDSIIYAPIIPFIILFTYIHYIFREKNKKQKERNRELAGLILKPSVLFGKSAIYHYVRERDIIANNDIWYRTDSNFPD
ncbi:MAG: class I SAM-dependent methyltransferase [Gammaproteobacteria bacterium]